jgi:hypothetical protein
MTVSFEEIDNKDRVIKLSLNCNILTISSLSAEFPKGQVFHQADVDEMIPLFKRAVEEMERYKKENPEY